MQKIWLDKISEFYKTEDTQEIKKRLFELNDILVYLNETLVEKKTKLEENDIHSEQLVLKFYLQNESLLSLSNGHKINTKYFNLENSQLKYCDISSIMTIVRSQYETLLMYQHLYVNSTSKDEQRLRYYAWIMTSLIQRLNYFFETNQVEFDLDMETNSINYYKNKIKLNPNFNNLTEKQQKQLIEKGNGKLFKNWETIYKETKFGKNNIFGKLYFMASVYAHSEGILALQLKETNNLLNNEILLGQLNLLLFSSYLMTNIFIVNISNRFEVVKEKYLRLDEQIRFEISFNYQVVFNNKDVA